jgi:hypothetical protein
MASDPYTGPLAVHQRYETTHTLSPRFRTLLLTGGASEVGLALVRHYALVTYSRNCVQGAFSEIAPPTVALHT